MTLRRSRAQRREDSDHPAPEPVGLVRWSRVSIGLLLIAAGIIWSLINSRMGVSVQVAAPTATPSAEPVVPDLGTAQSVIGRTVNAKQLAVVDRIGGQAAPAGGRFLLIAVRVSAGATGFVLAASDFALRAGGTVIAHGRSYPGHAGLPSQLHVHAGSVVVGTLVFPAPGAAGGAILAYAPRDHPRTILQWRLAPTSR